MATFILITFYILFILSEKTFFLFLEPIYRSSFLGKLDYFVLLALFAGGLVAFVYSVVKSNKVKKPADIGKSRFGLKQILFLLLIIITIASSFYFNMNKVVQEWDSVALYDARAKFLENGVKFSDMTQFSKYDEIDYYYLMYPPFTSIAHYIWNSSVVGLPVSVSYSIYLLIFSVTLFFLSRKFLGDKLGLVLVLLTITNKDIFVLSILEYTNLPFTMNVVFGVFLLADYLKSPKWWKYIYAVILISTSQWIRYLEPVWLLVAFVFLVVYFNKKNWIDGIVKAVVFILPCVVGYLSWGYFAKTIAGNPNPTSFSPKLALTLITEIYTHRTIEVVINFVKSFGILLLGYASLVIAGLLSFEKMVKVKERFFLWLFVLFSILFYFSALYFSSFQGDWWKGLGGSLIRSSSFLIPISLLFLLAHFKEIAGNHVKKMGR